jgi:hypothetical protein
VTDLQWFAFVILPICVGVFGAVLASVGVKLINHADRRKPAANSLARVAPGFPPVLAQPTQPAVELSGYGGPVATEPKVPIQRRR